MKKHFLIALCYREVSATTIRILKKFFFHPAIQANVIKESLEIFIRMLKLLYQPDTETDCKENVREFLEHLHQGGEDTLAESNALREFVYQAIKKFAEENPNEYQQCNLIELMNKVVQERRGNIFGEENDNPDGDAMSNSAFSNSS